MANLLNSAERSRNLLYTCLPNDRDNKRTFGQARVSKTQKVSFENLKTESDDYKVKAQRILQSKGNDFIFAKINMVF